MDSRGPAVRRPSARGGRCAVSKWLSLATSIRLARPAAGEGCEEPGPDLLGEEQRPREALVLRGVGRRAGIASASVRRGLKSLARMAHTEEAGSSRGIHRQGPVRPHAPAGGRFHRDMPARSGARDRGDAEKEALANASDALAAVIEAYEDLGKPLGGPAARAGRCADVARDCCCPGMKYREASRGLRALAALRSRGALPARSSESIGAALSRLSGADDGLPSPQTGEA